MTFASFARFDGLCILLCLRCILGRIVGLGKLFLGGIVSFKGLLFLIGILISGRISGIGMFLPFIGNLGLGRTIFCKCVEN